ncbi:hypothetical protein GCK32_000729 [Trichostrongylus colubriformis]|uniref:BTB domain-containing protein n=1 Tax=Trichostrongylus colubriformis TaxID=6319 RepID=A0AAN8ISD7_TRICO
MLDSPYADLPVDHQCVEEYIGANESIDKVFIDDPECMVRISPTSTLKLFTYRTPIIYRGARDPNFSVVDYNGPGFITHTEERLIEEHYRSTFMDAEHGAGVVNSIGFASVGTLGTPVGATLVYPDIPDSVSDNNSCNVPNDIIKIVRSGTPEIVESHEESVIVCAEANSPLKRLLAEEDSTDEEEQEAGVIVSTATSAAKRPAKSPNQTEGKVPPTERRMTRSASRIPAEGQTTPRPVNIAMRRSSAAVTKRGPCRSSCVSVEDKVMTPSGSVDIKIHVDSSLTPTFGMITRSRDRNATTLVVDVRTPPQRSAEKRSAPYRSTNGGSARIASSPLSGSRKRPHRELERGATGITPVVHRLNLDIPCRSTGDASESGSMAFPKVRSAPTTPSKVTSGSITRMGSKWSLSKLDTRATAIANLELGEPPSKMRRIYGFMRRLVGLGLGNGQWSDPWMSQASSVDFEPADECSVHDGAPPFKTSGCVTRFDTVDLRYAWVIEDFSAQMDLHSIGEHLTSKNFGDNDHEFVLKLFPAGKDEDCTGYISLYLQIMKCPNPKIQLRIRFSVETPEGSREYFPKNSVLSINRYGTITASKFFHSDIVKNRFLRRGLRDALTVSADITVFLDSKTISEVPFRDLEDDEVFIESCFDLPDSNVYECGAETPKSDFIVDVEDRQFHLHRCVLATTSQYFSAMLKEQTLEGSNGRVELKDVGANVFEIIVNYIYEVKRPQSDEITVELIKAVDMLMMDGLKAHCCAVLMRDITVDNFTLRLEIADFLNADRLFKRLAVFLASNRREVFARADWVELRNLHPKMVCRVMEYAWSYAENYFPYAKFVKRRRLCY